MNELRDCPVCAKHCNSSRESGRPVYEDDLLFVGHAAASEKGELPLLGHYLVEPKRHIAGIGDLDGEESRATGRFLALTARAIQTVSGAEQVYVFVLGHQVDHLHIHLVPRYPGTPRAFWGIRVDEWEGAPRGSVSEIARFNAAVREELAKAGIE